MGGGKGVEVGPMSLCVACGLKEWNGNQLGGEGTCKTPGLLAQGHRAGTSPFVEMHSSTFLPLLLCHEKIPQGIPLLPMVMSSSLGNARGLLS